MDIQRRKSPRKQGTQGDVQFRTRVFNRPYTDESTSKQGKNQFHIKTQQQGGDDKSLFAGFRSQMGALSGGMRAAATKPRNAYKSIADKSRHATQHITKFQKKEEVQSVEEKVAHIEQENVQVMQSEKSSEVVTQNEKIDSVEIITEDKTQSLPVATRSNNALSRFCRRVVRRLCGGAYDTPLASIRVWQVSMISAMFFGMVTMSAIMWNFGQSVEATDIASVETLVASPVGSLVETQDYADVTTIDKIPNPESVSAGEATSTPTIIEDVTPLPEPEPIMPEKAPEQVAFEERVTTMVSGYPIEKMLPEIFKQDMQVAAYIIAMAKIESAWGKRVPVLAGQDCFNYWGYRLKRERMGTGGHTCFDDYADAVETVGKRIEKLVYTYEKKTPRQMLVWKCGSSCATHDPAGVERWVGVVAQYRNQVLGL